jgi:tetratricopeptide (TPR) repeat protein
LRAETLLSFAQTAADNADKDNGLALLERAAKLIDGANWTAQQFAEVMGATARCQKTLGQADAARASLRRAEDKFAAERESIWNFERAAVLRPIALAQAAIGDSAAALATFRRAFDDGAENPNGRPRAEDLTATCCALAQSGLEPGEELMKRVREIRAGLKAPW